MSYRDSKLDKLISDLQNCKNSNDKLRYYKKAIQRLVYLKKNYNEIIDILQKKQELPGKSTKPPKEDGQNDDCIETIKEGLQSMHEELDQENIDMVDVVNKYVKYKSLLTNLKSVNENFKNEIYHVEQNRGKIIIKKLELDDI
jgi:chromosome condensin MukBEF ATPase and DNA-binding subunit MukB